MRERAVRSGRVAQPGLGIPPRELRPFAPGPASWQRDTDELISATRVYRDLTLSPFFSRSARSDAGVGLSPEESESTGARALSQPAETRAEISHFPALPRAEPHRTRSASSRGAVPPRTDTVAATLSPQLHRGTSGTTSGGSRRGERVSDPGSLAALAPVHSAPGTAHVACGQAREADPVIAEELSGPQGTGLAAAPTLYAGAPGSGVICSRCRDGITRNELLRISFCPTCGLGPRFLFWSQRRGQFVGV